MVGGKKMRFLQQQLLVLGGKLHIDQIRPADGSLARVEKAGTIDSLVVEVLVGTRPKNSRICPEPRSVQWWAQQRHVRDGFRHAHENLSLTFEVSLSVGQVFSSSLNTCKGSCRQDNGNNSGASCCLKAGISLLSQPRG